MEDSISEIRLDCKSRKCNVKKGYLLFLCSFFFYERDDNNMNKKKTKAQYEYSCYFDLFAKL